MNKRDFNKYIDKVKVNLIPNDGHSCYRGICASLFVTDELYDRYSSTYRRRELRNKLRSLTHKSPDKYGGFWYGKPSQTTTLVRCMALELLRETMLEDKSYRQL